MRAAGYTRVSTAGQVEEGESLQLQKAQIEKACLDRGWPLVRVFEDAGFSGAKADNRPAFQEMFEAAKAGEFDVLMVSRLSRFGRSLKDVLNYKDRLKSHGVKVSFLKEGVGDATPHEEMFLSMLGAIAQYEREVIREQTFEAKMRKWRDKRMFQGVAPFGWKWNKEKEKIELDKPKAAILKRIITMYVEENISFKNIAIALNREGLRGPTGALLSGSHISWWLKDTILYGKYVTNAGWRKKSPNKPVEEHIIFDAPPLIDKATYDAIQARTERNKLKSKRVNPEIAERWARDIVSCGICGAAAKPRRGNLRKDGSAPWYYACFWSVAGAKKREERHKEPCPMLSIPALEVENFIRRMISDLLCFGPKRQEKLKALLSSGDAVRSELDALSAQKTGLEKDRKGQERKQARLMALMGDDDFDQNAFKTEMLKVKARMAELDEALAGLENRRDMLESSTKALEEHQQWLENSREIAGKVRKFIAHAPAAEMKKLAELIFTKPLPLLADNEGWADGPDGEPIPIGKSWKIRVNDGFGEITLNSPALLNYFRTIESGCAWPAWSCQTPEAP